MRASAREFKEGVLWHLMMELVASPPKQPGLFRVLHGAMVILSFHTSRRWYYGDMVMCFHLSRICTASLPRGQVEVQLGITVL